MESTPSPTSQAQTQPSVDNPSKETVSVESAQPAAVPPVPAASGQPVVPTTQGVVNPPATAEDDDLIEKAWVDAAEGLARQYAEDPYALQEAVEAMSRDYLKKRFGLEIRKT
ncbi:hypothetical protein KBC99_00845 [Candidatus Saccharibacteria bacterium]|nr:hypothetical protein [Candidatus Saccharibacteria bacterium]